MAEEFAWVEKYRPKTVDECILPKRIKDVFKAQIETGEIQTMLLTGGPGMGKTTVARALCDELNLSHVLRNSSDDRGISDVRGSIKEYATTVALEGGYKVQILDEADNITRDAQEALRGILEQYSSNCKFILTGNNKNKLMDAIQSRCLHVDFSLQREEKPKLAKEFFGRVKNILEAEGVAYEVPVLMRIVTKHFPDFRRTLNELQGLSKIGPIDKNIEEHMTEVSDLSGLKKNLKEKDFHAVRKWIVENMDNDSDTIFNEVYMMFHEEMKPSSLPQAVVTMADYQYKDAFVANKEVNFLAWLTETMIECEFK